MTLHWHHGSYVPYLGRPVAGVLEEEQDLFFADLLHWNRDRDPLGMPYPYPWWGWDPLPSFLPWSGAQRPPAGGACHCCRAHGREARCLLGSTHPPLPSPLACPSSCCAITSTGSGYPSALSMPRVGGHLGKPQSGLTLSLPCFTLFPFLHHTPSFPSTHSPLSRVTLLPALFHALPVPGITLLPSLFHTLPLPGVTPLQPRPMPS